MKCLAGLFFLLGGLAGCWSAEYSVRTWDVDDGLPESGITDVIQSPDGYLWISTLNSGISRFDGVRFVNYEPATSSELASHGFRRLFYGADGTLWVNGYGNYLATLRAGTFHREYAGSAVVNWLVWTKGGSVVFATKEGQLLEGTSGTNDSWKIVSPAGAGGNARFFADQQANFWYRATNGALGRVSGNIGDEKSEIVFPAGDHSPITTLAGSPDGLIAAGTAQKLLVGTGDHFQDLTPTNGEPAIAIRGLVPDGQGGWWVEANNRLRRCQSQRWIAEAKDWRKQKLNWSRVKWEQPDSLGGLWMAYTDGGLIHVSATGRLSAVTTRDGLPSSRVRTMTQDREGNLWASFERGGLICVRPRVFQSIGSREGLSDIVTTSVCEDSTGAIWIGTLGGTVSRWDHGTCTNFTLPLEGTHCEMTTVYPGTNGDVWIGTHGNGLLLYRDGQFSHVLSLDQVGVNVRGLFVGHDGQVWIASQDGLFCLSNNVLRKILAPKAEDDYPTAVAEGAGGRIWVAMNSGRLVGCDHDEATLFATPDLAIRRRFSSVFEDAHGEVWIGTLGGGLLHFQNGQFAAVTSQDGLPTDTITQVIDGGVDRLWLGSPVGVIAVEKKSLEARLHGTGENLVCHAYGRNDGLPTVGCAGASQPTAWLGHDGRLWFATSKGIASARSQDPDRMQRPPLVVVEGMRVDGETANTIRSGGDSPAAPIRLSPGQHQIEFRYTGLSFNDPERIRFQYMLEGFDPAWIESNERMVSYHQLPPGQYRFRVKAQNSNGMVSPDEASLALIIPPHLWETGWFRLGLLGAILAAVAGSVFGILQARHTRELRQLEHRHTLERERTRIARDIHDDLGASLTRITMLSQSALNKPERSPAVELSRIYQTARSMTNAMDEIVWAINPSHDTLESLAAYFAEFVQEFLAPTGLKFNLEMPLALPAWTISSEVRHNLFLAFKEALNNVVKHAHATEVVITLEVRDQAFVLSVTDDGRGFDAAQTNGAGNGLSNMQRRLKEAGGCWTAQNLPGGGTRVSFEVPVHP
jgi:signal transduction histidine kinase/ligand-binding sensor domain-containing protein